MSALDGNVSGGGSSSGGGSGGPFEGYTKEGFLQHAAIMLYCNADFEHGSNPGAEAAKAKQRAAILANMFTFKK